MYGPTGPTGPMLQPSGFTGSGELSIAVTSTGGPGSSNGTLIQSKSITITQTGYIWASSTITFSNASSSTKYLISAYMTLNSSTSNVKNTTIDSYLSGSINSYSSITLSQRTYNTISPGTYTCSVYAYVNAGTDVESVHCDTFILGHLYDGIA